MKRDELMRYAKNVLGVETRTVGPNGKKTNYRAVEDVKRDCKAVQARLCQPPQENQAFEPAVDASRQGVRQRGRAKGQGQEARPRGSAKKGKSFPGRKVVPASRSPDRAQKWGEGRRYSPRSGSNRSEAREPRRRLDGGPSSSSHFLKIASPAVVCGCYAVAAPAAMTADTRPVPGLGAQATR